MLNSWRETIGWGVALAALFPLFFPSYIVVAFLAGDGLDSFYGMRADLEIIAGICLFSVIIVGVLLGASRLLLKRWPRIIIYILLGMIAINCLQIAAMEYSIRQIEQCGSPVCDVQGGKGAESPD